MEKVSSMEIAAFVIALGVGVALGMYISSQVMHSIDRSINRREFDKNMQRLDKEKREVDVEEDNSEEIAKRLAEEKARNLAKFAKEEAERIEKRHDEKQING